MYEIRYKCNVGESWHYVYITQIDIDTNVMCEEHPGSTTEDFVVIYNDNIII